MYVQVSISAEESFPLTPKWIRINLPFNEKMWFSSDHHVYIGTNFICPVLQIWRSCHFGWSWHFRRPPERDWPGWFDPPGCPEIFNRCQRSLKLDLGCVFNEGGKKQLTSKNLFLLAGILFARNSCDAGKVLDDPLSVDSLSGTRFSARNESNMQTQHVKKKQTL